jgi:hypothetical protein
MKNGDAPDWFLPREPAREENNVSLNLRSPPANIFADAS